MDQSLTLLGNKFVLYDPTHRSSVLTRLYLRLPQPIGGVGDMPYDILPIHLDDGQ